MYTSTLVIDVTANGLGLESGLKMNHVVVTGYNRRLMSIKSLHPPTYLSNAK